MTTISAEFTPHAAVLRRIASSARRGSASLTFRDDEPEFRDSLRELARHGYLELQRAGSHEWTVRLTERGRNADGPQGD